ncbi:MAG: hypothetical protein LBK47_08730 [Prevotellaceae bacterium]|jgi:hypothetical protein|nr:hypothetical protein [Prevotellaceae bacterium]
MTEFSGFRYAFLSITRVAAIPSRARSCLTGLVGMTGPIEVKSGGVFCGGFAAAKPLLTPPAPRNSDRSAAEWRNLCPRFVCKLLTITN